jgi:hypothetical protein
MISASAALRPGGHLVLIEGHPLMTMVATVDPPVLRWQYQGGAPIRTRIQGDYATPNARTNADEVVMYLHGIGEVTSAAIQAGMVVEALTEWTEANGEPNGDKLSRSEDGMCRMQFAGAALPVEYGLRARKPERAT